MVWQWLLSKVRKNEPIVKTVIPTVEPEITPLIEVKGIGQATVNKFNAQGIYTVEELIETAFSVLQEVTAGVFTDSQLRKFVGLAKNHVSQ